jgi:DNA-binding response OmpR family regulator
MEAYVQKVLIVEDNVMIADMVEEVLLANGYDVCGIVDTVAQGVALCREHKPDLAIIDLRLADGELGTNMAAQRVPFGKLGILYATGNMSQIHLTLADGHACIAKPYSAHSLLAGLRLVTQIVEEGHAVPPFPPGFLALLPASCHAEGRKS